MKNISRWARRHPLRARLLIGVCYIILNACAYICADLLAARGIRIATGTLYLTAIGMFSLVVAYPGLLTKPSRASYTKRKVFDTTLAFTSFLLIGMVANRHLTERIVQAPIHYSGNAAYALKPSVSTGASPWIRLQPRPIKLHKKGIINKVRSFYHAQKNGKKNGLVILVIVLACVAFGFLGALSCSISCGGAEGLAFALFILGTVFIVAIVTVVLRRIYKKPPPPDKETAPDEPVQAARARGAKGQ